SSTSTSPAHRRWGSSCAPTERRCCAPEASSSPAVRSSAATVRPRASCRSRRPRGRPGWSPASAPRRKTTPSSSTPSAKAGRRSGPMRRAWDRLQRLDPRRRAHPRSRGPPAAAPGPGGGRAAGVAGAADAATRADQTLLTAAAAIASGSPREAERMLWGIADRADSRPDVALVYGRAVETALDLSPATRAERGRSAYERVLDMWPASWEATIAHAVLAGARRGREEAGIEALRDLDPVRAKAAAGAGVASPLLDAFEAITSGDDHLFDRAH